MKTRGTIVQLHIRSTRIFGDPDEIDLVGVAIKGEFPRSDTTDSQFRQLVGYDVTDSNYAVVFDNAGSAFRTSIPQRCTRNETPDKRVNDEREDRAVRCGR